MLACLLVCWLARTIQAGVLTANSASSLKLLSEPLPGTMETDGQIIGRGPKLARCIVERLTLEVHALKQPAVLGWQTGQKPLHTLADDTFI